MSSHQDKQRVMLLGIDLIQRQLSRAIFRTANDTDPFRYHQLVETYDKMKQQYGDDWHTAFRINHNSYRRVSLIKQKIGNAVKEGSVIFLTLTFTDSVLAKTSAKTRRRYVAYFLKSQSSKYIANLDYGKTNGREHYHALVSVENVDLSAWKYGAINAKRVRSHDKDALRVSKYVAKLTNHAIKQTASANRLIFSRLSLQFPTA